MFNFEFSKTKPNRHKEKTDFASKDLYMSLNKVMVKLGLMYQIHKIIES